MVLLYYRGFFDFWKYSVNFVEAMKKMNNILRLPFFFNYYLPIVVREPYAY
ncbi:hypothetical protein KUH03_05635 [Sphingobacterium sp. E70]|uniref:hypothetical protein n=1 Tax=Sphingobacterium sp. E70 TaxID=2853439 RepID=UPI00211CFD1C|nr:hypothetical protein [Sphingobacterium sp. E70]ULT26387.1 hypothetical protein KUH03_05635 [Sphingobacterium sp. E70]